MRTVRCAGRLMEVCLPRGYLPDFPSPPGQNDRRLWKHSFSTTTVADGKERFCLRLCNPSVWIHINESKCKGETYVWWLVPLFRFSFSKVKRKRCCLQNGCRFLITFSDQVKAISVNYRLSDQFQGVSRSHLFGVYRPLHSTWQS